MNGQIKFKALFKYVYSRLPRMISRGSRRRPHFATMTEMLEEICGIQTTAAEQQTLNTEMEWGKKSNHK